MSVSMFLKAVRNRREMSQKQLADALGVNIMTISRLESKEDATLTPKMASKIAQFIDDDDLSMLDSSDPQDREILNNPLCGASSLNRLEHRRMLKWTSDVRSKIDVPMQEIGYTLAQTTNRFLLYRHQTNKKNWLFVCHPCGGTPIHHSLRRHLAESIGRALLYSYDDQYVENKITIAIPYSYYDVALELPQNVSRCLPFDLSILHFDNSCTIQQETYLRFNTDGRGIFDLDVDDTAVNAQAGKDYLAWTRAVGNIVMLEKNK